MNTAVYMLAFWYTFIQVFRVTILRVIIHLCGIICSSMLTLTRRTLTSSTEMHQIYRRNVTNLRS